MRSNFLLIAFLFLTAMGFAQNVDVSGSVLDLGTGEPIPSVNIFAKDYKIGTSTDFDGNFALDFQIWNGANPVNPLDWVSY